MDRWTEMRTAYHVARLGTVSAAAEALGLHRASVNRHIDALEEALGARIFLRHARGYTVTELGQDLLRVAQKTDTMIEDLALRARNTRSQIDGEIKLTILPPFARLAMAPVARFRAENPACQVTILATEDLQRLEFGEAHVALRAGPQPDQPDYVVSLFRDIGLNLYAHDRYIARYGMPAGEDDLTDHVFVLPELEPRRLPFADWLRTQVRPDQVAIQSASTEVGSAAVIEGLGLGFLPETDVEGRSDLHPVLPAHPDWRVPVWLVTHVDLHRTAKVQAMLRCLRAC